MLFGQCLVMAGGSEHRRRLLVFPREHGAWAMLLVPLATGSAVGVLADGRGLPLVPLTIAAISLLWLRTPVESYLGTAPLRARSASEQRLVRHAAIGLTGASVAAFVWLFSTGGYRYLGWVGGAVVLAVCVQAYLKTSGRSWRVAAQLAGLVGLTAAAPAAYYVSTNRWNALSALLWITNWLFAANQIQFVHLRIHAARLSTRREKAIVGKGFLAGQVLLIALLAGACGARVCNYRVALAFLPSLGRGFAWFLANPQPLAIRTLGLLEVAHAAAFGVLLVWALGYE